MSKLLFHVLAMALALFAFAAEVEAQKKSRQSSNRIPVLKQDLPTHAVKVLGESRYKCGRRIQFVDDDRVVSFGKGDASIIQIRTGEVEKAVEIKPRELLFSPKLFGNRWIVLTEAKRPLYQVEILDVQNPGAVFKHQLEGSVAGVFEDGSMLLVSTLHGLQLVRTSDAKVVSSWKFRDGIRQINQMELVNQDSAVVFNCMLEEGYKEGNPLSQVAVLGIDRQTRQFGEFLKKFEKISPEREFFQLMAVSSGPFASFVRGNGDFAVCDYLKNQMMKFPSTGVGIITVDIDKYSGRVVTTGASGFIDTWDSSNGDSLLRMRTRFKKWCDACFSESGRSFATSVGGRLRIWDAGSGKLLRGPDLEELSLLRSVAISADEKNVAVADLTGRVEVWDIAKGKRRKMAYTAIPEGERRDCWVGPNYLSFSKDGKFLLGGSDQTANLVNVWSTRKGEFVSRIAGHSQPVKGISWSPDNEFLAAAGRDDVVLIVDSSGNIVRKLSGYWLTGFLPDGKHVVTADSSTIRKFNVIDVETGVTTATLIPPGDVELMPHGLAVAPKNDLVAVAFQMGDLVVWNHKTRRVVYQKKMEIPRHFKESTAAVSFSADGSTLAFSAGGREILLLDAKSGKEKLRLMDTSNVVGLSFGKSMLASVADHHVTLWKPKL